MKIIFLDFDGVITTLKSNWKLDNEKMTMIKEICDETGAKIVISSSWRRYNLEQTLISLEKEVPKFILSEYVIGVTGRCYGFKYGNAEKHISIERGNEIKIWIDECKEEPRYYEPCILKPENMGCGVNGYFYCSVLSPKYFSWEHMGTHAVICDKNFNIVHDPNPEYKGIKSYPLASIIGFNGIIGVYNIRKK